MTLSADRSTRASAALVTLLTLIPSSALAQGMVAGLGGAVLDSFLSQLQDAANSLVNSAGFDLVYGIGLRLLACFVAYHVLKNIVAIFKNPLSGIEFVADELLKLGLIMMILFPASLGLSFNPTYEAFKALSDFTMWIATGASGSPYEGSRGVGARGVGAVMESLESMILTVGPGGNIGSGKITESCDTVRTAFSNALDETSAKASLAPLTSGTAVSPRYIYCAQDVTQDFFDDEAARTTVYGAPFGGGSGSGDTTAINGKAKAIYASFSPATGSFAGYSMPALEKMMAKGITEPPFGFEYLNAKEAMYAWKYYAKQRSFHAIEKYLKIEGAGIGAGGEECGFTDLLCKFNAKMAELTPGPAVVWEGIKFQVVRKTSFYMPGMLNFDYLVADIFRLAIVFILSLMSISVFFLFVSTLLTPQIIAPIYVAIYQVESVFAIEKGPEWLWTNFKARFGKLIVAPAAFIFIAAFVFPFIVKLSNTMLGILPVKVAVVVAGFGGAMCISMFWIGKNLLAGAMDHGDTIVGMSLEFLYTGLANIANITQAAKSAVLSALQLYLTPRQAVASAAKTALKPGVDALHHGVEGMQNLAAGTLAAARAAGSANRDMGGGMLSGLAARASAVNDSLAGAINNGLDSATPRNLAAKRSQEGAYERELVASTSPNWIGMKPAADAAARASSLRELAKKRSTREDIAAAIADDKASLKKEIKSTLGIEADFDSEDDAEHLVEASKKELQAKMDDEFKNIQQISKEINKKRSVKKDETSTKEQIEDAERAIIELETNIARAEASMKASETKKKNLDRLLTSFEEHQERLTEQERIMGRWSGVEKDHLRETKKGDWLQPRDAPKTSDEFMRAAADSEVGTQAHRDLTSSETGGSRGGEIRATDRAVPIEETVGAVVGGKAATAKGAEAPGPSLGKSSKATTGGGDEGKSQGADAKATESALDPLSDQKAKAKWVHEKHSKIDKNEESIKKLTGRNSELLQASKNPAVFVLEAELRTEVLEGMAKEIEENECKISELKKDIKIVETEIKTEVEIPRSSGNSLDRKKKPMEKPQEPPPDVT